MMVRPVLTYRADRRVDTNRANRLSRMIEMSTLGIIVGKRAVIQYEIVSQKCQIEDVANLVIRREKIMESPCSQGD